MLALILIGVTVLLTMAVFYLKCEVLTSITTLLSALFGIVAALGYHEVLGSFILSKGYGQEHAYWASALILFVVVFAVLRTAAIQILNPKIEFSPIIKQVTSIVCGGLCGLLISGMLLIVLAMSPASGSLSYSRYNLAGAVNPDKPAPLLINADGWVSGLFSWISRGSLSGTSSYALYHPDPLNQIHLNRAKGAFPIAGKQALKLPGKNYIRQKDITDTDNISKPMVVVRMGFNQQLFKSGGAANAEGNLTLALGQVRMICGTKGDTEGTGVGTPVYPAGFVVKNKVEEKKLGEVITLDRKEAQDLRYGNFVWKDIAFQVPSGLTPKMLNYKYNVFFKLDPVVAGSEEIEKELNAPPQAENTEGQNHGQQ
jgi:hypothetical protein